MVDAGARRFVSATDLGRGYSAAVSILMVPSPSPLPSHRGPAPLPTYSRSPLASPPFHLPSFSRLKVQHLLRLQP